MDDSVLARGLYQDDVIYADETKLVVINTPPCEVIRVSFEPGHEKMAAKSAMRLKQTCAAFLGRKCHIYYCL